MTCSSSVGLIIRCNITPCHSSKVSSEDKLSVVTLMQGGHNRAHGGRVPRVPRGGYAPVCTKSTKSLCIFHFVSLFFSVYYSLRWIQLAVSQLSFSLHAIIIKYSLSQVVLCHWLLQKVCRLQPAGTASFTPRHYSFRSMVSVRRYCTSVTLGVASSVANGVIMRTGAASAVENDIIMIIPGIWRYGDWRHVATGCNALV